MQHVRAVYARAVRSQIWSYFFLGDFFAAFFLVFADPASTGASANL
jgi:hypothetical protein